MTAPSLASELYLITPEKFDLASLKESLQEILEQAPVSCFQIRIPEASDQEIEEAVKVLAPLCWDKDIAVLLCDHVELVQKLDLDGVHLESNTDAKYVKEVRKTLGNDRSIGVSCLNSTHTAMLVGEAGADYVSFGPLFPSPTKGMPAEEGVRDCLRAWALAMELPCVAVGGITPDNVTSVFETGAEFYAPISGIWDHEGSAAAAAKAFSDAASSFKTS